MYSLISTQGSGTTKIPAFFIYFNRCVQYLKVGRLLHLMTMTGLFLFLYFGSISLKVENHFSLLFFFYGYLSLYGLALIAFSQLDARARFQNYKLAKDLLFEHGFKERIANIFCLSKCQREAIGVAAKDLGMEKRLSRYYRFLGYRWYHLIPDKVLSAPSILLTRVYWKKTLFVPTYSSRYFLW